MAHKTPFHTKPRRPSDKNSTQTGNVKQKLTMYINVKANAMMIRQFKSSIREHHKLSEKFRQNNPSDYVSKKKQQQQQQTFYSNWIRLRNRYNAKEHRPYY